LIFEFENEKTVAHFCVTVFKLLRYWFCDRKDEGGAEGRGVMEEKKLSWSDRLLKPVVNAEIFGKKLIPDGVTPNHLSMARAVMVLPAAAALWNNFNALAVVFLAVAVVLDIFDGAVARIREQTSSNGEWIDAYADKMLIGGMLILYGWSYFPHYLIGAVLAIEDCGTIKENNN
jgi:hypothetical protein